MRSGRIYDETLKIALVVSVSIIFFFAAISVVLITSPSNNIFPAVAGSVFIIVLYTLTRFFRAGEESPHPRPLWKVTASRPLGWFFGGSYLVSGTRILMDAGLTSALTLSGFLTLLFGALLITSAIMAGRSHPKPN